MLHKKTNAVMDLCRHGIVSKNDQIRTAAQELSSFVMYASIMLFDTDIPDILVPNYEVLVDFINNPENYPDDIEDED